MTALETVEHQLKVARQYASAGEYAQSLVCFDGVLTAISRRPSWNIHLCKLAVYNRTFVQHRFRNLQLSNYPAAGILRSRRTSMCSIGGSHAARRCSRSYIDLSVHSLGAQLHTRYPAAANRLNSCICGRSMTSYGRSSWKDRQVQLALRPRSAGPQSVATRPPPARKRRPVPGYRRCVPKACTGASN